MTPGSSETPNYTFDYWIMEDQPILPVHNKLMEAT